MNFFIVLSICLVASVNCLDTNDFAFIGQNNNPEVRIIGGHDAKPHAYPYQVALFIETELHSDFCGGSLITPNVVLTAAHCTADAVKITALFGAHNVSADEKGTVSIASAKIITHEDWNSKQLVNDIALVKLSKSVQESSTIKIIPLASETDKVGSTGAATGWGITKDGQTRKTSVLQVVDLPLISNEDCKKVSSSYNKIIKDTHQCTSGEGTKGICSGDSGGPLVVDGLQVGISSFGYKFCEQGLPSVFTRVAKYRDWIEKNM